jgi:hypothetical protein
MAAPSGHALLCRQHQPDRRREGRRASDRPPQPHQHGPGPHRHHNADGPGTRPRRRPSRPAGATASPYGLEPRGPAGGASTRPATPTTSGPSAPSCGWWSTGRRSPASTPHRRQPLPLLNPPRRRQRSHRSAAASPVDPSGGNHGCRRIASVSSTAQPVVGETVVRRRIRGSSWRTFTIRQRRRISSPVPTSRRSARRDQRGTGEHDRCSRVVMARFEASLAQNQTGGAKCRTPKLYLAKGIRRSLGYERSSSPPRYSAPASGADCATLGPVGMKLK